MARIKPRLKAAWVLLFFCLLAGAGTPAVWAGDDSGVQVVLTLDLAKSPVQVRGADPLSQTAGLLVHLLPEQDYLGLTATGAELPAAQLGTEERREILETLAALKPAAQPQPFAEILAQSLKLFQPAGPKTRVLFILSDVAGAADSQKTTAQLEEIRKIAAQARQAKIRIFAVCRTPGSSSDKLKILTSETGGCLWEAKTATDLYAAVLNFYGGLGQHQQAPLTGTDFRLDPWVKKAMVVALHAIPGKSVVLTMPGGARITPRTPTRNASWVAGQAYDLITIFAPRPGIWSLSGAQPADSRVFLETNLTLTATGIPRVAGADEALRVTAALSGPEKTLAGAHGLGGTEILAELQMNHNPPSTIKLMAPESDASSTCSTYPPGDRVGRFPPQHREGDATLRVTALGKTFQRSVELPITITQPWYRVVLPTGAATKFPPISFQPDQERLPQQLEGTVTLQSALGSLAGVLINPHPGSTIIMARPAGCQDACLADLQLTGTGPGGRPLAIASGPRPLTNSPTATVPEKPAELAAKPAAEVNTQTPKTAPVTRKSKRRWLWLALVGVGLAFFGVAGWLFWEEGREGYDSEDEEAPEDGSGKSVLRLQAQVEALLKEKAQLQAALEEKDRQAEQFQAEKAELQAELERAQSRSQGSSKTLEELEKRLEEAEKEAKGFQQEYMALYARSQEEKDTIKKN